MSALPENVFKGKKILIGITGSIAAYKIPLLVRMLKKRGALVKVIMTPDAHDFVTPLTLSVLSENPVFIEPFDRESGAWNSHIDLALWADLMLIAPVSANTIAKMVAGIADNLLLTTWLACRCPVFFAPAMDLDMYRHLHTQRNINTLVVSGNLLIEPRTGELASGLCGAGRMEEPEAMMVFVADWFKKKSDLSGKSILITAGPTREAIDPVRYISNHSSGKMGYAIAHAMAMRGAEVRLISGPVEMAALHPLIQVLPVTTAVQMYEACLALANDVDIMVMAAAVADYRPEDAPEKKIKKEKEGSVNIPLVLNPDILATLGKQKKPHQILVGFALETDHELENAQKKLRNKKADIIVLNSLAHNGAGFGTDTNRVTLLFKDGDIKDYPLMPKIKVAEAIVDATIGLMNEKNKENGSSKSLVREGDGASLSKGK